MLAACKLLPAHSDPVQLAIRITDATARTACNSALVSARGSHCFAELTTTMKELGDLLTADEIAKFVKIMDKDNNGVVEVRAPPWCACAGLHAAEQHSAQQAGYLDAERSWQLLNAPGKVHSSVAWWLVVCASQRFLAQIKVLLRYLLPPATCAFATCCVSCALPV